MHIKAAWIQIHMRIVMNNESISLSSSSQHDIMLSIALIFFRLFLNSTKE